MQKNTSKRPLIIAICGLHGAGKTTLCNQLFDELQKFDWHKVKNDIYENIKLVEYRHIDYPIHEVGKHTRNYSLPYIWAKVLDYAHFCKNSILPLIDSGVPIISDRWNYCYLALAMCQKDMLLPVKKFLKFFPTPDLIIYLNVEPEVALKRIRARGLTTPEETLTMLHDLRGYYDEIFESIPNANICKIVSKSTDLSYDQAMDRIKSTFKLSKENEAIS